MNKKHITIISVSLIILLIVSFLISIVFRKRTDVVLFDYSVAEDGTAINLGVQASGSMLKGN